MKRYFFCPDLPEVGAVVELPPAEVRHLRTVLRVTGGEQILLLNGAGVCASAQVEKDNGRRGAVWCRIETREIVEEPALKPILYLAPPRAKLATQLVRQAAELGVWEIVPVRTHRGVAIPSSQDVQASWRTQTVEAGKQSGNPFLPKLSPVLSFDEALKRTEDGFFGEVPSSAVGKPCIPPKTGRIAFWVGPEGGFCETEREALKLRLKPLTIGPWILRIETAALAGLAWLRGGQYACND